MSIMFQRPFTRIPADLVDKQANPGIGSCGEPLGGAVWAWREYSVLAPSARVSLSLSLPNHIINYVINLDTYGIQFVNHDMAFRDRREYTDHPQAASSKLTSKIRK